MSKTSILFYFPKNQSYQKQYQFCKARTNSLSIFFVKINKASFGFLDISSLDNSFVGTDFWYKKYGEYKIAIVGGIVYNSIILTILNKFALIFVP